MTRRPDASRPERAERPVVIERPGPEPGRTLVCIPTSDNAATLPQVVARLRAACPDVDVLVVDDDSADGTGLVADLLAAAHPFVSVTHRLGGAGFGTACLHAFAWAQARWYDRVVTMTGDGAQRPEEVPDLLAALDGADLAVGVRRVAEAAGAGERLARRADRYAAALLRLRDTAGTFRAYRTTALDRLRLDHVDASGGALQVELLLRAAEAGLRIREVEVTIAAERRGRAAAQVAWLATASAARGRVRRTGRLTAAG